MKNKTNDIYMAVSVQACINGWVVSCLGAPPEVFVRWESAVRRLEDLLTTKGGTVQYEQKTTS